jgi:hypothetical protein
VFELLTTRNELTLELRESCWSLVFFAVRWWEFRIEILRTRSSSNWIREIDEEFVAFLWILAMIRVLCVDDLVRILIWTMKLWWLQWSEKFVGDSVTVARCARDCVLWWIGWGVSLDYWGLKNLTLTLTMSWLYSWQVWVLDEPGIAMWTWTIRNLTPVLGLKML